MSNDAFPPPPQPGPGQPGQPPYGQQPPAGYYQQPHPQQPYPQQPYQQAPYGGLFQGAPLAPQSEASTALWAHLGPLLALVVSAGTLSFVVPLVMWLAFRDRSHFVGEHAKESLNFQITLVIVIFVSIPLMFVVVGVFTALAAAILGLVWMIQASMAAYRHEPYRYPLNIRFIK